MKKSTISTAKFSAMSAANRQKSILDSAEFAQNTLAIIDTLPSPQARAAGYAVAVADGKAKCPAVVSAIAGKGANFQKVAQFMTDFAIAMRSLTGTKLEYTADKVNGRIITMRKACDSWAKNQGEFSPLHNRVLRSAKGQATTCYIWEKVETEETTGTVETSPADVPAANAEKASGKAAKATGKEIQKAVKGAIAATQSESAETIAALQAQVDQLAQDLVHAKCGEYRALLLAKSYKSQAGVGGAQKGKLTKAITAARVAADKAMQSTGTVAKQRAEKLAEIKALAAA